MKMRAEAAKTCFAIISKNAGPRQLWRRHLLAYTPISHTSRRIMPDNDQTRTILNLTVQIVAAHVRNNQVPIHQLSGLIRQVHEALALAGTPAAPPVEPEKPAPSVAPRRSVYPDYIICLEDGRRMKTLKRHLRATYDMSPEQYREKWNLPPDSPMVAPNYAAKRSKLAKQLGLGRRTVEADIEDIEKLEPLEQMPARPWQVVSAPPPVAPPPALERRPEPTLDSVFRGFPKAQAEPEETEAAPAGGEAASPAQRRSARKPFSKQLARTMRP
jgi:predicted transcriptional regulator